MRSSGEAAADTEELNLTKRIVLAGVIFTLCAGSAFTARADEGHEGWGFGDAIATTVTGVSGTITALNYTESGAAVDGFLVGTNVLLLFPKAVCGGISSLGKVGDSVKYSGIALTFASGFQTVNVTSYTDGAMTYPPPAPPKPTAYPLTAGTITQLNYSENGFVNGFVFAPSTAGSSPVFVNVGMPSSTLALLLKAGAAVSVTGMLEAPPLCAAAGTISEVDASSITIGSTAYPIGGTGMGFFFGGHRGED